MGCVSQVRLDPLTDRAVVLRPERIAAAPAFAPGTLPTVASCPFCPGQEHLTRDTIAQLPAAGPWLARAFPNRRPALLPEIGHHGFGDGLLQGVTGVGAHEVIVETRDHHMVTEQDEVRTLQLAADRLEDLTGDQRFAAVTWFRNRCAEAGSSQPHPHSQILATPHVPALLRAMRRAQEDRRGLVRALIARAEGAGRVVCYTDRVVAFTPWAPSTPFEVWLAPVEPAAQLWQQRALLADLGALLHRVTTALDGIVGRAAHNVVLYGAPLRIDAPGFCWHVRILPRLVASGGFELWSGEAVHPVPPEDAAAVLRGFVP